MIRQVGGLDVSPAATWRWRPDYEGVDLDDLERAKDHKDSRGERTTAAWEPLSDPVQVPRPCHDSNVLTSNDVE